MIARRWQRASFDPLVERLERAIESVSEEELLRPTHWALGEDARLREDERFRETPWGRWMRADRYLANDEIARRLQHGEHFELGWLTVCEDLGRHVGLPAVVCTADPRLRFDGERVRLASSELTDEPLLENVVPLQQYVTHLPVLTLKAAAASEPAGEWGSGAEAQVVEPRGWLRVELDRPLNRRMFVARLKGSSMDDGRSRLTDGAWVVFEFSFHEGMAFDPGTAEPDVLVRGDFYDGETVTFAVKRWDRRPDVIRLRSLNPDRARYPDIVVDESEADTVRVVATVRQPLAPSQFGRRPRPKRRTGYRPIATDARRIGAQLASSARSFFEGLPPPQDEEEAEATAEWCASLVCLSARDGGPHLEVGPLLELPKFVKQLRVEGIEGWQSTVLAANARHHPLRVAIAVARGPWRWTAVGFEEELAPQMEALLAPALDASAVTLFRVDGDGVGRRASQIALGERYRVLVPPSVDVPEAEPIGEGWRLWEVVADESGPEVLRRLHELGLAVGEAQIALAWSLPLPDTWRRTPRGEEYACFRVGTSPVARVESRAIEHGDDAVAILARVSSGGGERSPALAATLASASARQAESLLGGAAEAESSLALDATVPPAPSRRREGESSPVPDHEGESLAQVSIPLPVSASPRLTLEGLECGRYVLAVVHRRVAVRRARLCFEIVDEAPAFVPARWSISASGIRLSTPQSERMDLGAIEMGDDGALVLRAPPGWPVAMTWSGSRADFLGVRSVPADGVLPTGPLLEPIEERRRRDRIGDWTLDFGELGSVTIPHQRKVTPEGVRAEIDGIVKMHRAFVEAQRGAFTDLLRLFVGPICGHLGYELADEVGPLVDGPVPSLPRTLKRTERGLLGIEPAKPVRLLVVGESIDALRGAKARAWIDGKCKAVGVRDAILTNGIEWTTHRIGSTLARTVHGIVAALEDDVAWQRLLQDLAEGV